ncbi:MAG: hypothetical protein IPM18_16995 [Phycisphaerales bacterium]|nr:hypothetical protein [Phycisphaerales bacterium]
MASVNPAARIGKAGQVIGKGFAWAQKGARTARVTGKAAEHLFKILPFGQAKKLTRGFNHQIEAHKLLEWRHMKGTGISLDDLPAVILPRETHKQITRELMRLSQNL